MVTFENRRGATFLVVSTGSAEGRRLQPGMGQLSTRSTGGGAERDRTADLVIANDALSQLSYGPVPVIAAKGWDPREERAS